MSLPDLNLLTELKANILRPDETLEWVLEDLRTNVWDAWGDCPECEERIYVPTTSVAAEPGRRYCCPRGHLGWSVVPYAVSRRRLDLL